MPSMQDAAKPLSRYAPFRRVGDLANFAGITAVDPGRGIVLPGYSDLPSELRSQAGEMSTGSKDCPIAARSWFVLDRLCDTVTSAGGRLSGIVKLTCNLRDFPIYNEGRAQYFRDLPASTIVRVVEFLPTPNVLLEVEAIAHIPEKRR